MIPKRWAPFVFIFLMAVGMSGVMSLVMLLILRWRTPMADILSAWPRLWLIAFLIALPTALTLAPLARALTGKLTAKG